VTLAGLIAGLAEKNFEVQRRSNGAEMKIKIIELILVIAIYLRCPFRLGGFGRWARLSRISPDRNLESYLIPATRYPEPLHDVTSRVPKRNKRFR
jgi:hypothetical protein